MSGDPLKPDSTGEKKVVRTERESGRRTREMADLLELPRTPAAKAFAKRKRNRVISRDHHIVRWERIKVSESHILARKRRIGAEHGEERVDYTVMVSRIRGKGRQAKRTSLRKVEGNMSGRVDARVL